MMKFAVFTAALLGAAPAFAGGPVIVADEAVVATPAPVQRMDTSGEWGGFYGGAQLGYGSLDGAADDGLGPIDGVLDLGGDGLIGGVHAGYRMDFGSFVAGAELGYDLLDITADESTGELGSADLDNMASLKLMGGIDLGQWLAYGAVGMTRVGSDFSAAISGDDTLDGRFAGLGAEYALSDSMSVGGEVLQHTFDNDVSEFDMTTVQARVNFRF